MDGKRILLIDDNPSEIEVITYFLGRAGALVNVARTCAEGMQVARKHRPRLILCDLRMVLVDGHECAKLIKSDPSLASIHLVAFTGVDAQGLREKCLASGFDDYMVKPMEPRMLADMLMGFIK